MGALNDGLRQNLKMSDLRTAFAPTSTSAIAYSDICTWVPSPNNYTTTGNGQGSGHRKHEYYLEGEYYYVGGNSSHVAEVQDKPFIMQSFYGRYKTSTSATPTTLTHVFSTDTGTGSTYSGRTLTNKNVKMSNYVGLSQCPITTDTCGQTRGVKGGYTTAVTVTSPGGGGFQTLDARDPHSSPFNAAYSGKKIPHGLTDTNIGMSVVRTYYTNNWSEIGLNTICAEGDRVVVVATSQGGTMYTFSTTDPIYLRTSGGSSVSAVVSTHYGPTKNETGSDTWMAVYSAFCSAGGAARVGINPYHSGNGYYIFYIFVIKGPQSNCNVGVSNVYTTQTSTVTYDTFQQASYMYPNMQPYTVSIQASPFVSNGHTGTLPAIGTQDVLCIAQTPIGVSHVGAGFVSVAGHGGGVGLYATGGKYNVVSTSGYSPQTARKIPRQDARSIIVYGSRGHQFGT